MIQTSIIEKKALVLLINSNHQLWDNFVTKKYVGTYLKHISYGSSEKKKKLPN